MADRDYSSYQKKVIQRYYDNRDQLDHQKLSELVTNIYLETGKKREKFWQTAEDVMQRMKVPESRIKHVMDSRDPAILAAVVEDIQSGKLRLDG
jgi:hypothetical protein